jgi:gliding motility-associatede transport system auxiliary component
MTTARARALCSLVAVVGVAGALSTAQSLLADKLWRIDFTPEHRYVLSQRAAQILGEVDRAVRLTGFVRADDPRNHDLEDLLHRASAASPYMSYRLVDLDRNPAVARQYDVDTYGAVVVESGEQHFDLPDPDEQTLLAAIVQVTHPKRHRVYFVVGQGEHGIHDRDRREGYTYAYVALLRERYQVEELELGHGHDIPADASALVVAGPRSDLPAGALQRIDAFVRGGGGLLVLLDPGENINLVALLERYGVTVGEGVVLDERNRLFAGDFLTVLIPGHSTVHPVGAGLLAPPLMSRVRPVSTAPSELRIAGVDLLKSAPESWSTTDPRVERETDATFIAGRDVAGPISVAAAVLVRPIGARPGRVLTIGDSDFAANYFLDYLGNRDLFLNAVGWVCGEDEVVASRAPIKEPGAEQFFVSADQGRLTFWIGTVVQPVLVLLIGALVYVRRRRSG